MAPTACDRPSMAATDLVILDVMLPVLDGFEVLRQLRLRSNVPVIMLTARAEEHDRVRGFGEGVDDYLVKPFAAAELLGRIRAVLRRTTGAPASAAGLTRAWCADPRHPGTGGVLGRCVARLDAQPSSRCSTCSRAPADASCHATS